MYRLRRWLPWLFIGLLVVASRLKVPAARSAAAQLRLAAECGFVPGGQAVAALAEAPVPLPPSSALPGHHPSQRDCMKFASSAVATSTTLGSRLMVEAQHQWQVFKADSQAMQAGSGR
jgi:hypothetical protein